MPPTPLHLSLLLAGGAAAATVAGAVLVSAGWLRQGRMFRGLLSVSSGLMMGLAVFRLVLPAGQLLEPSFGDLGLVSTLMGGMILGALGLVLMRRAVLPLKRTGPWLVLLALMLHDLPEGLAIGTAVGAPQPTSALPVALAIGLQNLLDGAAAMVALSQLGWSSRRALPLVFLASMPEVGASLLGTWGTGLFPALLPLILLGTAGALLELVRSELLPLLREQPRIQWLPLSGVGMALLLLAWYLLPH